MNVGREKLKTLLEKTLRESHLPGMPEPRRGKVRDVYDLGDRLLMVATDRVSAFDVVVGTVPLKGQVLTAIAAHFFERTADLIPNHLIAQPDPAALLVKKLKPLPVEVIVRRYITGSLWQDYQKGGRRMYGIHFREGLRRDERLENPIITMTTKGERGEHDLPLTHEEVVSRGLASRELLGKLEKAALRLFARGEELAARKGLILVDTKYEFGLDGDRLTVMDEIHTPDSSRYWEAESYRELFQRGQPQRMLDKENLREWLRIRGFTGEGRPPMLDDEIRLRLAETYAGLQERLLGHPPLLDERPAEERLLENLRAARII